MKSEIYIKIAKTLCYPNKETVANVKSLINDLNTIGPEFNEIFGPYLSYLESKDFTSLEESYTQTFDVQAVCPLEVGYALFGEDYKRGEFLVRVSGLHKEYNSDLINSELADYLPNILMLLAKIPENEFKKDFIEKLLMPALARMVATFDQSKEINPFSRPIRVLSQLLNKEYKMNSKILEVRHE